MLLLCTCTVARVPAPGYKSGEDRCLEDCPFPQLLPARPSHQHSPASVGSWGPSGCWVAPSPGVLGRGLPKHSFIAGAKHLVQLVTVPPGCQATLPCLLASRACNQISVSEICLGTAARCRYGLSGRPPGHLGTSCHERPLLSSASCPPAYGLHMATGNLSASPCSSLVCFNHLPGCFSVFCWKDEFGLCR